MSNVAYCIFLTVLYKVCTPSSTITSTTDSHNHSITKVIIKSANIIPTAHIPFSFSNVSIFTDQGIKCLLSLLPFCNSHTHITTVIAFSDHHLYQLQGNAYLSLLCTTYHSLSLQLVLTHNQKHSTHHNVLVSDVLDIKTSLTDNTGSNSL